MSCSVAAPALQDFMSEKANSLSREAILRHRLIYDLQVAAAARGYFLEVYSAEVDQDGFDLIIDDRDVSKMLQVKSVGLRSSTQDWAIHKSILRPNWLCAPQLGLEQSQLGVGVQGGGNPDEIQLC